MRERLRDHQPWAVLLARPAFPALSRHGSQECRREVFRDTALNWLADEEPPLAERVTRLWDPWNWGSEKGGAGVQCDRGSLV